MARSYLEDPMLTCNFALIDVPVASAIPLAFPFKLARSSLSQGTFIGMSDISIPAMNLETTEIREGNNPYVHEVYTGYHTGGDCTLRQAVLAQALDMRIWFDQCLLHRVAPRRNFLVAHLRQDRSLPARLISLRNCIVKSYKPASDFAALSSEVSYEEITMGVQYVEVFPVPEDFLRD